MVADIIDQFGSRASLSAIQAVLFVVMVLNVLMVLRLAPEVHRLIRVYFLSSLAALFFRTWIASTYIEPPSWWGNAFWLNATTSALILFIALVRKAGRVNYDRDHPE